VLLVSVFLEPVRNCQQQSPRHSKEQE
jgi:hypothetical protein